MTEALRRNIAGCDSTRPIKEAVQMLASGRAGQSWSREKSPVVEITLFES
jgi:hypothetical protein